MGSCCNMFITLIYLGIHALLQLKSFLTLEETNHTHPLYGCHLVFTLFCIKCIVMDPCFPSMSGRLLVHRGMYDRGVYPEIPKVEKKTWKNDNCMISKMFNIIPELFKIIEMHPMVFQHVPVPRFKACWQLLVVFLWVYLYSGQQNRHFSLPVGSLGGIRSVLPGQSNPCPNKASWSQQLSTKYIR